MVIQDAPFEADNFLAELFGDGALEVIEIEAVCRALALVPIDFEYKKYALLQDLARRNVKLELWMVEMMRGGA